MNLLLDTHTLIWVLENNSTLSNQAKAAITDGHNLVYVSAVSIWEISIKTSLGKLQCPNNLVEEISLHRFTPLAINFEYAQLAGELPPHHLDPFDRLLIAQGISERLVVVTRDAQFSNYKLKLIKA